MFDLKGKVAIVTGGSSGIGAAIGQTLVQNGAVVINFDVLPAASSEMGYLEVDVSKLTNVNDAVAKVVEDHNKIDILINNAGISQIGTIEETSAQDYERVFNVNVKGVYHCTSAVVPIMKQQNAGVIINMASVAANVGISQRFVYSASKGAVRAMTFALAKDYLAHNIRCNCVSPGRVHTPFVDDYLKEHYPGREEEVFAQLAATQPIGRMGTPEEIAALVLYLCSDEASFITGTDYGIDGGFIKLNS